MSLLPPACRLAPLAALLSLVLGGCSLFAGKPNQANIKLRKENQKLREQIGSLQAQHGADLRALQAWQERVPALPTLPAERLGRLFTVHGLKLGKLTGGADLDRIRPGDEGVKVYVVPTDDTGQPIKAAGSFTVEVFDLAAPQSPLIGHWTFDLEQSKQSWNGSFLDYTYVLTCPWQVAVPQHAALTLKVDFLDELTQTTFSNERKVIVRPPPPPQTTRPATTSTSPATAP